MEHPPLIFLVLFFLTAGCAKEETATCTCKDPWGNIKTREVHTSNDKKEMAGWREQCKRDGLTYHTTSTTGTTSATTSTYVPCELK